MTAQGAAHDDVEIVIKVSFRHDIQGFAAVPHIINAVQTLMYCIEEKNTFFNCFSLICTYIRTATTFFNTGVYIIEKSYI